MRPIATARSAAEGLDDPNAVPPKDHTRTSSKLSWVKLADGLPEYRERRLSGNS